MKLLINQKDNIFYLKGVMNEFAKLHPIAEFTGPVMILNFKEVKRINSIGVRELIATIEQVDSSIEIIFDECSSVVVYQMVMIPNFGSRVKVKSVYAPYYCPECDYQEDILIEMENFNLEQSLLKATCQECDSELEFDDDEKLYFWFINEDTK